MIRGFKKHAKLLQMTYVSRLEYYFTGILVQNVRIDLISF